jgi:predicted MPP superfamily phosphohydrolase
VRIGPVRSTPPCFGCLIPEAGADLVLAGHTHGGQLGIPFLSQRFNFARLTNQRSRGPVYSGKTTMYVNAGLGTTGPPMRLAVPPEIALITLRRARPHKGSDE